MDSTFVSNSRSDRLSGCSSTEVLKNETTTQYYSVLPRRTGSTTVSVRAILVTSKVNKPFNAINIHNLDFNQELFFVGVFDNLYISTAN